MHPALLRVPESSLYQVWALIPVSRGCAPSQRTLLCSGVPMVKLSIDRTNRRFRAKHVARSSSVRETSQKQDSEKEYGVADLVALSIGCTVGSGVFSLAGRVAAQDAGPAVVVSMLIGIIGCLLSASAYAELSCLTAAAGSVYAYAQIAGLGRPAMAAAATCLTMEYAVSCSAVAVDWSAKLARELHWQAPVTNSSLVQIDMPAAILVVACTIILATGTSLSRQFTNIASAAKVLLVIFLIGIALSAFNVQNLDPFVPVEQGVGGVLRGATASFFGFIGFDEICCLSAETRQPNHTIPVALFLGLAISGLLTVSAALALVAAVPAATLDPAAGFVSAFEQLGYDGAARVAAVGELVALPLVAFGCLLPQSRLICKLAEDGFLPQWVGHRDGHGQPLVAISLGGGFAFLAAAVAPFDRLNDVISASVLVCFILASMSAITVRFQAAGQSQFESRPLGYTWCFASSSLVFVFSVSNVLSSGQHVALQVGDLSITVASVVAFAAGWLALCCAWGLQRSTPMGSSENTWSTPCGAAGNCVAVVFCEALLTTLPGQSLAAAAAILLTVALSESALGGGPKSFDA